MHEHLKLEFFLFFCLPIGKGSFLYGITYDQTCPSDCSQKSPVPFKCVIKGKAGWKLFEQNLKASYDGNDYFGAPIMTSIDWYLKSYAVGLNPSLNVSFTVPNDSIKGVLLEFSSPGDLRVQDVYYHENRKFRLFEINTENIPLHKPISIFYDCMSGLDENDFRVYEVTLQSLPGARATYYVTTYYQDKLSDWKPAIATSTLSGTNIYVVFEDAPPEMNASQYSIDLVHFDEKKIVQSHQVRHPDLKTSQSFLQVNPGKYYVQISVYSPLCSETICKAISWNVTIPVDGHGVPLENHDVLTKTAITLASLVGLFIILGSVICYILRARQKQAICCCMSGTSSGARIDQVNNLKTLKTNKPFNGGEDKNTFRKETDEKIIYKDDEAHEHESELKPSDKSSGSKVTIDRKENDENLKLSGKVDKTSTQPDISEICDVHEEEKPLIADDRVVPNIPDINFVKQVENFDTYHSETADDNNERSSYPLSGKQRPIRQKTPWCPVHSRLRTNAPSNTCPVHGSAVHQKYCQLLPNKSRAQLSIYATENEGYSQVHRRDSLGYERYEKELMRINSLCDVSEV
ncbi:hypothetical protein CHS0354_002965 [Potamilus streckersoni]|uniref:ILCR1 Ig-like domain-containing protein n=1 Tax=Potamilus streckersoni TaxID=2493646 RepID=A0AAE0RSB2_9BIVA|nr:hypothetical protein CHS0354_002965 [Potamilus streckersoni]